MPTTTPTAPRFAGGFVDPRALMAIRNLELRARIVVEGFWIGLHRSPYHGFSVEFTEYRPYTPGDDTRYLDWRLYARSDRYYIKRFEDETNLRCQLVVDQSRSMHYGTAPWSKSAYARTLAATLAWFLAGQGDAVGLVTFDSKLRSFLPARHRQGHLRHLMMALEDEASGDDTSLDEPLRRVAELTRKRGLIALISDLLAPIEQLEHSLARLAAAGHELVVFQVLDRNELTFDFSGPVLLEELENRREMFVDPRVVRDEYLERFTAHNQQIDLTCRKLGVACHRAVTEQPLELALLDFLRSRAQRGKRTHRRGPAIAKPAVP